jgi:hypothetical protein
MMVPQGAAATVDAWLGNCTNNDKKKVVIKQRPHFTHLINDIFFIILSD